MSTETIKISAKNVNVFYGAKQAIDNVSIDIATEHVTAFIGPSGCGKTTTLRMIGGHDEPTAGTITFAGRRIDQLTTDAIVSPRIGRETPSMPCSTR